jgi:hypothetical protein
MNSLSPPLLAALLAGAPAQAIEVTGVVDLRAVAAHGPASWTREGLGKLRYDPHNDGLRLGQAMLRGDAELGDTVSGVLIVNAADDRSRTLNITEGWLRWNPIPSGPWKTSVRAGQFFPAMSLENDGIGWTPTRSISTSAINSWIGEELRTRGLEVQLVRRGRAAGDAHDLGINAAVFAGNDPIGTLLTWRGWSISDRITGISEPLELADLPVYRPDGRLRKQSRRIHVFREFDDRLGYQASVHYGYGGWLELSAMRYDNRADPLILVSGQYGWRTRFQHANLKLRRDGWELLGQAMQGTTFMGPPAAGVDFRAWYVLASHAAGPGKLSVRYDRFKAMEDDQIESDPNGEKGNGVAIAYALPLGASWSLVTELLTVRSERPARTLIGAASRQTERNLAASMRWQF